MKKYLILLMAATSTFCFAQPITLDRALDTGVAFLVKHLPRGMKVAAPSINAPNELLRQYVTDKLVLRLIYDSAFIVVKQEPEELERIADKLGYQLTGVLSDEIILSMSRHLDAQLVITGELSRYKEGYRLIIKALNVETARLLCQWQVENIRF